MITLKQLTLKTAQQMREALVKRNKSNLSIREIGKAY